jgi:hypothetical protein
MIQPSTFRATLRVHLLIDWICNLGCSGYTRWNRIAGLAADDPGPRHNSPGCSCSIAIQGIAVLCLKRLSASKLSSALACKVSAWALHGEQKPPLLLATTLEPVTACTMPFLLTDPAYSWRVQHDSTPLLRHGWIATHLLLLPCAPWYVPSFDMCVHACVCLRIHECVCGWLNVCMCANSIPYIWFLPWTYDMKRDNSACATLQTIGIKGKRSRWPL